MEELGPVHKAHERRRLSGSLGHIINLQPFSLIRRRLHPGGRLSQNIVEHTGSNPHGIEVSHPLDQLKQLIQPLACLGGDENHRA